MDSINDKCWQGGKSDEEINKLVAPEGQNFIDRAVYLLRNGQQFQKIFICQQLHNAANMEFYMFQLIEVINEIILNEDEVVVRDMCIGLSRLGKLINLKPQIQQQLMQHCIQLLNNFQQSPETLDAIIGLTQILTSTQVDFEQNGIKDMLYMESDHKMLYILKLIQVFFSQFEAPEMRQSINQIKESVKHKDDKVRNEICLLLINNQAILNVLINEIDWLDIFSRLLFDQSKEVRKSSIILFTEMYYLIKLESNKTRLNMMISSIIQYMEPTEFTILHKLSLIVHSQPEFVESFVERIKVLSSEDTDSQLLLLQYLKPSYTFIETEFDEHLLSIICQLADSERTFQFLKHLSPLYDILSIDMHLKILNILFSNFEPNQLAFLPYLQDIIKQTGKLKSCKLWTTQLSRIYELYKKAIFIYETKGLWNDIYLAIEVLHLIAKAINLEKDFISVCYKLLAMGANSVRKIATIILVGFIPKMDSQDQREQLISFYFQFQNNQNYQYRQLLIDFCIEVCKQRSRRFLIQNNILNVLTLQHDSVTQVRLKIPQLLYQIKLLLWNDEKDTLIKVTQIHQQLMQDKKRIVQQVSKELWAQLQNLHFHKPEHITQQYQINQAKEAIETANCKNIPIEQNRNLPNRHMKTEHVKPRNFTPTGKLPPMNAKRPNNFLQVPRQTVPVNRKSAPRSAHSKSPMPFKSK